MARCTNSAMNDVFSNGFCVICWFVVLWWFTQRGQGWVLLSRPMGVLMLMPRPKSPRKILMQQGALTVQCMMHLAMAFMSFINWLCYKALHNQVRDKCYLEGWWPCQCQCLCKCWCYLKKSWWHKVHQQCNMSCMMCSAMAFMSFIDWLYYEDLHNEIGLSAS